jgi:hypothetical protein
MRERLARHWLTFMRAEVAPWIVTAQPATRRRFPV